MCLLDEPVWHSAALMALGALLIMLINCWHTRMNKRHAAEIQRLLAERIQPVENVLVVQSWPKFHWRTYGGRDSL